MKGTRIDKRNSWFHPFSRKRKKTLALSAFDSVTGSPVSHYWTKRRSQLMFKGGKKMTLGLGDLQPRPPSLSNRCSFFHVLINTLHLKFIPYYKSFCEQNQECSSKMFSCGWKESREKIRTRS